jgi:hypothetical protein
MNPRIASANQIGLGNSSGRAAKDAIVLLLILVTLCARLAVNQQPLRIPPPIMKTQSAITTRGKSHENSMDHHLLI